MADFRRRMSTMQQSMDPYGSRSGLPMPSTVKKPVHHSGRMSMSGPALRAPYPVAASGPGPTPRHSMMRSQNMNPLLMSVTKANAYGRTPVHGSARRGSMWGGGSQGAAPTGSQGTKDTRPLRDRQFQAKMRGEVYSWLKETEFEGITPHTLQNITGRDFRAIFEHLVCLLDPQWPFDMDKRLDDQVIPALQALHYPYVSQIDLKWLATPGAQYSWPWLLGMLHWLAEMGKASCFHLDIDDNASENDEQVPEEFDDNHHHQALAFAHYVEAYEVFLRGADVYPEQERLLEERYAKKDESVVADLQAQRETLGRIQEELKTLVEEPPPIQELQKNNGYLKQDKVKFEECLRMYEERKQQLLKSIEREKTELEITRESVDLKCMPEDRTLTKIITEGTFEKLTAEQSRLEDIVKVQNLSPDEVLRMNTEHESLTRDLEALKNKLTDTSKLIAKLEVSLDKKLRDAEEALDAYTNLLTSMNLFPPLPPPLDGVDFRLGVNNASANASELLIGADVREVVKPKLGVVAELKRMEKAEVESETIKIDHELDQLLLTCENLEEEILEISKKVEALNEQADELREVAQREAATSSTEAARLEKELAQARAAAMSNGVGVKTRLQANQIAFREQIDKINRLRDETVRAIIKNSSEIVEFKEEVRRQLRNLRDFAEAN
ncbi:hypothetical protein NM688_g1916 [Phlebia brevispora]|uniref:Uncharacterized protein n=1 Tax=Phlebia brevispora TaxID=194682 RepID=A0ACC1TA58_9APHY|nr:hypothetical protein NM688_g1916 [Phlebia brevispora]